MFPARFTIVFWPLIFASVSASLELHAQEDIGLQNAGVEIVEHSWWDRFNPWSEEKRLTRKWQAGVDTPEALDLESLVLDEAHAFLLFDPVPERIARRVAGRWYTVGGMFGSGEYRLNDNALSGSRTLDLYVIDLRQAYEESSNADSFWTTSATYQLQILSDLGSENLSNRTAHSSIYYAQGKQWTAPVPWGRTSFACDLGIYWELGVVDEEALLNIPNTGLDPTTYFELGGYAGADVYQQLVRDRLSGFASFRVNYGGLTADNEYETFNDSRTRLSGQFGGGIELRIWSAPAVTARAAYYYSESEDQSATLFNNSRLLSCSLNF